MARAFLLLLVGVDDARLAVEAVHDILRHVADDDDEKRDASRAHFVQNAADDGNSRAVEADFVGGIVIHPRAFSGGEDDGGYVVFHNHLEKEWMMRLMER